MKAYLLISLALLFMALGFCVMEAAMHVFVAEAVARDLADAVGVKEEVLRPNLAAVLHRGWQRRAIIHSLPWLLSSGCFFWLYWKSLTESRDRRTPQAPGDPPYVR
ncbi:hypothetical protein [Planctomyces sp. SH-PL62]|uniref:hypothetical protein n=1 Tax=Planctomyces sp. SH-PL62 TaxID=1636152 RepID=UPI00078EDAF6|nr:hypothetical protein [Planctomyces sp. SH-PL62]AMV37926.1 hypothetical protein VT85_10855 [Planctomyces sp. SH-PL62]